MNLWILIALEIIFLVLSYILFDGDYFAPPVMTIAVVLIGTMMVIPSYQLWNVSISSQTIAVIATGFVCCCVGGCIAKQIISASKMQSKRIECTSIHWHKSMESTALFITILLTLLYMYDALRIGHLYGGSGFGAIGYMKAAYMSGSQGPKMNALIRQGFKVVMALAYISTYYFVNNVLIMKEKVRKNLTYLISFVCGCVITIFSGSRTEILRLVSALILDYVVLTRLNSGYNSSKNKIGIIDIIKRFAPVLIVGVIAGFLSRGVVKTANIGGSDITSIIGYVSYYIGSPIQVLNIKLTYFSNIKELLFGTQNSIPEFVYLGSLDYGGNVATIFGSCIHYNGLINMVIYLLIVYFIGTSIYYRLYHVNSSKKRKSRNIIVFSYCYFVFTMAYYSICTSVLLEFSNILILILLLILYRVLRRVKLIFRA